MADRIDTGCRPPESVRVPVCAWLERHGVDPGDVAVPGWIERQPELYRLAWLGYERDDHGDIRFDREAQEAVYVARYVQLEGPPLPWPDVLVAWDEGEGDAA